MLELAEVSKAYTAAEQTVHALRGATLSVAAGEFVAVQGPSGCGKTTLLLIAGGMLSPDSGRVSVAGTDPYALSPDERAGFRAGHVGFVFQQFHLVPYLDVLGNVMAAGIATHLTEAESRARELIERFGLTSRMHHVPGRLSTGERQRTALARALLNRPKLILADEPTGNLDGENGEIVLQHLAEFTRQGGAVLLVTHDEAAIQFAGRTIPIRDGRLQSTEPGPE